MRLTSLDDSPRLPFAFRAPLEAPARPHTRSGPLVAYCRTSVAGVAGCHPRTIPLICPLFGLAPKLGCPHTHPIKSASGSFPRFRSKGLARARAHRCARSFLPLCLPLVHPGAPATLASIQGLFKVPCLRLPPHHCGLLRPLIPLPIGHSRHRMLSIGLWLMVVGRSHRAHGHSSAAAPPWGAFGLRSAPCVSSPRPGRSCVPARSWASVVVAASLSLHGWPIDWGLDDPGLGVRWALEAQPHRAAHAHNSPAAFYAGPSHHL